MIIMIMVSINDYHSRISINKRPGGDISYDYDGGNDDYDNISNKRGGGEQDKSRQDPN